MNKTILFRAAVSVMAAVPAGAALAVPTMYEHEVARGEEARIIESPIGGILNSKWYDYRINVTETRKELASDLRHATDIEDQRDAYSEYASELFQERGKYVKYMSKRGYRVPQVYLESL
ncbi:hypothetical protein EDF56_101559 [Novosphingobium sp. PhB165]|uniref:hypothetical protein n=1 Tax=Novosphingobium sp. PhB165 TaxID=2485105 RepID=UPI0010450249|nr:hypothetical protein [Novosphingobium sp. PhB165]TCM21883.1 hypothetical protein EDF56_101559 [Novosphingobium sp. PhB165]